MSVADRLTAGVHTLTGQHLAKVVAKASSHEVMGPKRKHVETLISLTNSPTFSMPDLGNELFARCQNSSWVVVFKALITCHNLMARGHERFIQYMASRTSLFVLDNFLDKSGLQAYDMSTFIRRYSHYVNEKAVAYRAMAYDFCRVKRGKEDGFLRSMELVKLLQALPVLERLIDALLAMDITAQELTNGVINTAFVMLFKDLIKLFACYNDGVINLLEKFYELKKQQAREAVSLYRKFIVKMDRINDFMKVAREMGVENAEGDMPELTKPPASLLDTLENHARMLEKGGKVETQPSAQSLTQSFLSATSAPSSSPSQPSPVAAKAASPRETTNAVIAPPSAQVKMAPEEIAARRKQLEAEKTRLLELRQQQVQQQQMQQQQSVSNDLSDLSSAFGLQSSQPAQPAQPAVQNLQPFGVSPGVRVAHQQPVATGSSTTDPWATGPSPSGGFNAQFESVFGPSQSGMTTNVVQTAPAGQPPGLGDMLQPTKTGQFAEEAEKSPSKGLGKDLSSGLNKAFEDLDLGRNKMGLAEKTQHQWKEPSTQKTGGADWAPMQRQTVTVPQQQQVLGSRPADWSTPLAAGHFPPLSAMQSQMQPMMQPTYRQPGMMGGAQPMGMQMYPQQMMGMYQQQMQQPSRPSDPFGPI